MSTAPSLSIINAELKYNDHLLFQQICVDLTGGNWTCLLGASGVGKSSLLRLIAGLSTEAAAEVIAASDRKPLQGRIAYLAQNEMLLPWLSALDNVLIGLKLRGQKCDFAAKERAKEYLQRVGLEKFMYYRPAKLSGGMKQRVLLARTLFEDKPVILLDEPFAALDAITRTSIQELAFSLLSGKTVILVTHDPLEAIRLGHHVYVLSGRPAILKEIKLVGQPLRELTDSTLLQVHGEILTFLSHEKGDLVC